METIIETIDSCLDCPYKSMSIIFCKGCENIFEKIDHGYEWQSERVGCSMQNEPTNGQGHEKTKR